MPDNGLQHTIVVGVDGSENGRRALEWALEEAKLRQMSCLLVHGVEFGMASSSPYIGSAYGDLEAAGQAVLDQEVAFATSSGITISSRLDLGSPAHALIEASKGAGMLVVGTRGHGGFVGLLLGSVSAACVHHVHCPVMIIPPGDE